MALMLFREKNQVRWIGVRPGHNGEQIVKSNTCLNNTVIVHTVTAAKTFYLCTASVGVYGSVGQVYLKVRNGADVDQYTIGQCSALTNVGHNPGFSIPFNPPLEIPAGYDVVIYSNAANVNGYGFVFGWEE